MQGKLEFRSGWAALYMNTRNPADAIEITGSAFRLRRGLSLHCLCGRRGLCRLVRDFWLYSLGFLAHVPPVRLTHMPPVVDFRSKRVVTINRFETFLRFEVGDSAQMPCEEPIRNERGSNQAIWTTHPQGLCVTRIDLPDSCWRATGPDAALEAHVNSLAFQSVPGMQDARLELIHLDFFTPHIR